jgi:hypothetical protein
MPRVLRSILGRSRRLGRRRLRARPGRLQTFALATMTERQKPDAPRARVERGPASPMAGGPCALACVAARSVREQQVSASVALAPLARAAAAAVAACPAPAPAPEAGAVLPPLVRPPLVRVAPVAARPASVLASVAAARVAPVSLARTAPVAVLLRRAKLAKRPVPSVLAQEAPQRRRRRKVVRRAVRAISSARRR